MKSLAHAATWSFLAALCGPFVALGSNSTLHHEPAPAPELSHRSLREPGHHRRHRRAAPQQQHILATVDSFNPRAVQKQVENMAQRADKLESTDRVTAALVDNELENLEADLASRAVSDTGLEDEIRAVRAELCAKHGFEGPQRSDCEAFMREACIARHGTVSLLQVVPGQDAAEAEAEAATAAADADFVSDDDEVEAASVSEVSMALCRLFFREVAETESSTKEGKGPEEANATSPAGNANVSEAVPAGLVDDQQPWFELNPEGGLQENGFDGAFVDHDDAETQTADWQREFGPKSGHRSIAEICRDHPDNTWCKMHLVDRRPPPRDESFWASFGGGSQSGAHHRQGTLLVSVLAALYIVHVATLQ